MTDESGAFTMQGAPTGSFSIRVNAPQFRERIVTLDGRGQSSLRTDVDLQAGTGEGTELSGIGANALVKAPGSVSHLVTHLRTGPLKRRA